MQFDFYIVNRSFAYQESVGKDELEAKIESLAIDYNYIRQYKETDKIFVNPTIYEEIIYPGFTVTEFLYNPNSKKHFDRDTISFLSTIIDKSEETSISTNEVVEVLLHAYTKDNVHGLLCLHQIQDIDDRFLVYSKNNWLDFHRHFLGLYPQSPDFFIAECSKYFPFLYFNDSNCSSVRSILKDSSKKILQYLAELNNNFIKCKASTTNRIDLLKQFNSICNFDLKASIEGDIKRKKDLTFIFMNENGIEENVYCELHLKLLYNDLGKIEQNRIYFHEGKKNIRNNKILIGYIGVHL
jgi:hypothetical protein